MLKSKSFKITALAVIIFLSVLGVCYYTYLNIYEEELKDFNSKLDVSMYEIVENIENELEKKNEININLAFETNPSLKYFKDIDNMNLIPKVHIADVFTTEKLKIVIKDILKKQGFGKLGYEFCVQDIHHKILIQSDHYLAFEKQAFVIDPYNNLFKNMVFKYDDEEVEDKFYDDLLVFIVKDYRKFVFYKTEKHIILMVLFIIFITIALLVIVRNILMSERLNVIKNDFINNMTHELKTPLATLNIAAVNFVSLKTVAPAERTKMEAYKTIIVGEIKRLTKMVETILKAGKLSKKSLDPKFEILNFEDIIQSQYQEFMIQIQAVNGQIHYTNKAKNLLVFADKSNLEMMVSNLIDNAIKYSKDHVEITIETYNVNQKIVFKIQDKGIGMSRETVHKIFEKYYRAHTGDIHDVKGFGLGMTFVKSIIDLHKGKIKVESALKKGTTIWVELPLAHEADIKKAEIASE
ncbi:MAG: HAMP domain-containing sensor histidine kinase [Alphaproteobacteria bacterium]|nr:HAMP domain-containing sensor histidine kinase [Alphaproteobacteria bacterium]